MEDLNINKRIILRWNLKKVESAQTGFIWLRIRIDGEYDNGTLVSIKVENFLCR
jgi:hypothetical protein